MAKPKNQPVVLSAAQIAANASIASLTEYSAAIAANRAVSESRSKVLVAAIATLWAAFPGDLIGYQNACVEAFGNGIKTKDGRITGLVMDALVAAKAELPARSEAARQRKVAASWHVAAVRTAAEKGLRAAYDAAKPAVVTAETAETETASEPAAYSAEKLHALMLAHADDALVGIRQIFLRWKDTIALGKFAEVETHLASKTAAK
jgi:hypothetical protein